MLMYIIIGMVAAVLLFVAYAIFSFPKRNQLIFNGYLDDEADANPDNIYLHTTRSSSRECEPEGDCSEIICSDDDSLSNEELVTLEDNCEFEICGEFEWVERAPDRYRGSISCDPDTLCLMVSRACPEYESAVQAFLAQQGITPQPDYSECDDSECCSKPITTYLLEHKRESLPNLCENILTHACGMKPTDGIQLALSRDIEVDWDEMHKMDGCLFWLFRRGG
jgi:hypothetical protein